LATRVPVLKGNRGEAAQVLTSSSKCAWSWASPGQCDPSEESAYCVYTCSLDFYDYLIGVESPAEGLIDHLSRDFAYFATSHDPTRAPDLTLRGHLQEPDFDSMPDMPVTSISPRNLVYRQGVQTYLDYFGRGLLIESSELAEAFSSDLDLLREIFYLYTLSKVGLYLDRRGLHRIHAAALSFRGEALLLMCPSGSGKSTTTFNLLQRDGYRMLSEDSPLIGPTGDIHPFPLCLGCKTAPPPEIPEKFLRKISRMEFEPKHLIDLAAFDGKLEAQSLPPGPLIVGLRHSGKTASVEPLSKFSLLKALTRDLVIGIGIYQGVEFLFQNKLHGLLRHGLVTASRIRGALALCRRGHPYVFRMGRDIALNTETLDRFIRSEIWKVRNSSG
jgi:hypothetical protein